MPKGTIRRLVADRGFGFIKGERAEAQWAAWAAPGVSEVENNIIVSP